MAQLHQSHRAVISRGTGGIGKTTLARAYVQIHGEQYDHIAWINRGDDLIESIGLNDQLTRSLQLQFTQDDTLEARFRTTLQTLGALHGRSLLVIDNVEDQINQTEVLECLPSKPDWTVLMTSRRRYQRFDCLDLGKLDRTDARKLFRAHYTPTVSDEWLNDFLDEVADHTLTIEMAAKTLTQLRGTVSPEQLLERFQRRQLGDATLEQKITLNHSPEETVIYRHLLDTFALQDFTPTELTLLRYLAVLPPEPYPILATDSPAVPNLLAWIGDPPENGNWLNAINRLNQSGWIDLDEDTNSLLVHRMVQQTLFYCLTLTVEDVAPLIAALGDKLGHNNFVNPVEQFPYLPYANGLIDCFKEKDHQQLAYLWNQTALVLKALGDYGAAKDLLTKAMTSDEKNFGPDHPTTAVRYWNLGRVTIDLNERSEGLEFIRKAYQVWQTQLGANHPNSQMARKFLDQQNDA